MTDRWKKRAGLAVLAVVVVAVPWAVTGPPSAPPPSIDNADALCSAELGSEWQSAGVVHHPEWSVAHINCKRSTGPFSSDQQWISIQAPTRGGA